MTVVSLPVRVAVLRARVEQHIYIWWALIRFLSVLAAKPVGFNACMLVGPCILCAVLSFLGQVLLLFAWQCMFGTGGKHVACEHLVSATGGCESLSVAPSCVQGR
jgi:hypothetical protein